MILENEMLEYILEKYNVKTTKEIVLAFREIEKVYFKEPNKNMTPRQFCTWLQGYIDLTLEARSILGTKIVDNLENMEPEDFCYWLQGYFELSGKTEYTKPLCIIKDHLALVFKKVTPNYDFFQEIEKANRNFYTKQLERPHLKEWQPPEIIC